MEPRPWTRPTRRALAMRAGFILILLALAGWCGGVCSARWRAGWLASLPYLVATAAPDDTAALLATGSLYLRALPERRELRRFVAAAAVIQAERAPRRLGYYANAVNLLDTAAPADAGTPEQEFDLEIFAAGVYGEMERYESLFAALDRADKALRAIQDEPGFNSRRLILANAKAYFLAIAPQERGGNPATALELARLMVSSRDTLPNGGYASGSAAFLDTLAAARSANGDRGGALAAQSMALGLAGNEGLDVYIRHYDTYAGKQDGSGDER